MDNKTVTMAHGAGGRQTSELIDEVFKAHFANPDLTADDAAVLVPPAGKMAVSTDGFIVSPAFFPGGNIGKLSICGTVNDLACMGAKPMYLTCAFVIEEGFPMEKLEEIAAAMEKTAKEAGVRIVSGDTKVAGKGQVDGVFITTTGMGEIQDGVKVGGELAKPGDAIIVTGDVGRHGCTILLAREDFGIDADVTSDCAPLWGTVKEVMDATHNLHVIRDATRGGVGTVLYEIAGQSNVGIRLDASSVPVAPEVKGVCGMLGLEPLYLACEGRMVIMAPKEEAEKIVEALRKCPYSKDAAIIGEVTEDQPGKVVMTTEIGTQALLPQPGGELCRESADSNESYRKGETDFMDTRVALISIIVENNDVIDDINRFLHEAGKYIIGRMGIPYREKGINIISIAIDAPQDVISSLSGKIGRLRGVSAKTAYSNVITKAEDRK